MVLFITNMEEKTKPKTHPRGTAGNVLLQQVPTCLSSSKVSHVLRLVKDSKQKWDTIDYIYILGKAEKLLGVISIKELLRAKPTSTLGNIMKKKGLVSLYLNSSLEHVAITAVHHNIKSVPIADKKGVFKGVVGNDDILRTMSRAHVNHVLRRSGISNGDKMTDVMKASIGKLIRMRTPWLIVGLVGQFVGATLIGLFEHTLTEVVALAFFMPLVIYMGSAIGTQSETLYIRAAAMEKVKLGKYMWREFVIDLGIGIIASVFALLFTFAWLQSSGTAIIISIAVLLNMILAGQISVVISWWLIHKHKDPALGAGPFTTLVQDIASLVIYFTVATVLFQLI